MRANLIVVLCLMMLSSLAAATSIPDPRASVQVATDELLAKLVEVQPLYASAPEKFYSEIHVALDPFIDFDGFSRAVMAKYYRQATDAQKLQFIETFKQELVQTYAKALVEFDNQKVEVLPLSQPPEEDRATVSLNIHSTDGTVYSVVYTLALVDQHWKLRNVVINGINIGLQFRSQFQSYMQKYRNNIDEVIANWNVSA